MKADEARAAEWGDIVDGNTATKRLPVWRQQRRRRPANPYANKGQLLGAMPESLGKRFAQSPK